MLVKLGTYWEGAGLAMTKHRGPPDRARKKFLQLISNIGNPDILSGSLIFLQLIIKAGEENIWIPDILLRTLVREKISGIQIFLLEL